MSKKEPYADDLPYWKTSRSSPELWLTRTAELLKQFNAVEINETCVSTGDQAAYAIAFKVSGVAYRIIWPVVHPRRIVDRTAARVQATTFMFHNTKAKALAAKVLGFRVAFIGNLVLESGLTVQESETLAYALVGLPAPRADLIGELVTSEVS